MKKQRVSGEGAEDYTSEDAKISVIIPTLDEEDRIKLTLQNVYKESPHEVIVVDSGSSDKTVELAAAAGACTVVKRSSRGTRLNTGASMSTGDILLFLHADTRLPENYPELIKDALEKTGTAGGAFLLNIDHPAFGFRIIEKAVQLRSVLFKLPFGDQAVFIRAELFQRLGGFAELPIMEDVNLVRRMSRLGSLAIIPAPVITSPRRWLAMGIVRTTVINQLIMAGYYLGVPGQKLVRWYRRESNIGTVNSSTAKKQSSIQSRK